MKRIYRLKMVLAGCCLLGVGLSGQVWAEVPCSSSTEGDNVSIGNVGGSASCEAWGMLGCFIQDPADGSCTANDADGDPMFTVTSKVVGSEVSWSMDYDGTYNSESKIGAIDLSIWEGAKRGQNYPFLFRYDAGLAPDAVAMQCNGGTSTQGIHFCMDGIEEFSPIFENPGQPKVGLACTEVSPATMTKIYGVDIDVTGVVAGQGLTTITVARSNRPCAINDETVTQELPRCTDTSNSTGWEPDPAFGFVENGQIALNNVCLALSAQFVDRDQCDPDKDVVNGPFIDSLVECPARAEGIVREEVSVGFEGSGYVGYGGSRRYY